MEAALVELKRAAANLLEGVREEEEVLRPIV